MLLLAMTNIQILCPSNCLVPVFREGSCFQSALGMSVTCLKCCLVSGFGFLLFSCSATLNLKSNVETEVVQKSFSQICEALIREGLRVALGREGEQQLHCTLSFVAIAGIA